MDALEILEIIFTSFEDMSTKYGFGNAWIDKYFRIYIRDLTSKECCNPTHPKMLNMKRFTLSLMIDNNEHNSIADMARDYFKWNKLNYNTGCSCKNPCDASFQGYYLVKLPIFLMIEITSEDYDSVRLKNLSK